MKRYILAAICCIALFAACSRKSTEFTFADVKISPEIHTRVSGLYFEPGDRIGLTIATATGNYAYNTAMIYDGSLFTSNEGLIWYNNLNTASTLTAYYPYNEAGSPAQFSVATVQTSTGYADSDLLGAAKKGVTPTTTAVDMVFYHLMSQVVISVRNNSDGRISRIFIKGTSTVADVDLSVPTAMAKSGVVPADIEVCEITPDVEYRAIVVPQQVAMEIVVMTDDGKSHSKKFVSTKLESGRKYDISLTVSNIDLEATISGQISNWTEGGSISGDDSASSSDNTLNSDGSTSSTLTYEGENYALTTIGGKVWMAENLRYMPAGATVGDGVWYPDGDASNVTTLGLLYDHATAMNGATTESAQGICPAGWHIPTKTEFEALVAASPETDFFTAAGSVIGTTDKYQAAKSYLISSTMDGSNCYVLQTAPATNLISFIATNGVSLRCVKN